MRRLIPGLIMFLICSPVFGETYFCSEGGKKPSISKFTRSLDHPGYFEWSVGEDTFLRIVSEDKDTNFLIMQLIFTHADEEKLLVWNFYLDKKR